MAWLLKSTAYHRISGRFRDSPDLPGIVDHLVRKFEMEFRGMPLLEVQAQI